MATLCDGNLLTPRIFSSLRLPIPYKKIISKWQNINTPEYCRSKGKGLCYSKNNNFTGGAKN